MPSNLERSVDRLSKVVEELSEKFNPYHDDQGRFATGSGSGVHLAPDTGGGSGGGGGSTASAPVKEPKAKAKGKSIPKISEQDRESFLKEVVEAPGGKLEITPAAAGKSLKTGGVSHFTQAGKNPEDSFVIKMRAQSQYAEKFGGVDIAKSAAMTDAWKSTNRTYQGIPEAKKQAVVQYTTDDYYEVNHKMRHGGKLNASEKKMKESVDELVDRTGKWKGTGTIYHGVSSSSPETRQQFLSKVKQCIDGKQPWVENGILSCSASKEMSAAWIRKSAGGGILMRIVANKGAVISSISGLSSQQEILQKGGSRFRPTKVSQETILGRPVTVVDFIQK